MKSPRHTSLQRWNDRSASDPPTLLLKKRGLGGSSESTPGRHERLDSNKVILYHPVEEGDTLSGLTIRYNISTAEIKKTNNMWQDGDLHTRKWIKIPIPKYGILTEIKADKLCPPMTRSNSLGSKSVVDMQTAESPVQISNKLLDDVDEEIRVARTNMERIISANHKSQVTLTMAPVIARSEPGKWPIYWLIFLAILIPLFIPLYFFYDRFLTHFGVRDG